MDYLFYKNAVSKIRVIEMFYQKMIWLLYERLLDLDECMVIQDELPSNTPVELISTDRFLINH